MNSLIPLWIIGGPFVGILILAYSFKGASAMGGSMSRLPPRGREVSDHSTSFADPVDPRVTRRNV